jgi:hypothetical protein
LQILGDSGPRGSSKEQENLIELLFRDVFMMHSFVLGVLVHDTGNDHSNDEYNGKHEFPRVPYVPQVGIPR